MLANRIRNIKGFVIILILTSIVIVILKLTSSNKNLVENNIKPFVVKTEKVVLKNIKPEYLFYGNVKAKSEVDLVARLSGKIIKTSTKILTNQYFEKEEIIFELDPFNFKQELIKKESKLKDLISELNSMNLIYTEVKQQQELSQKDFDRKKKLVGDIVTKKNLEDSANNLSVSNAKVLDINSKLQSLKADIEIAKSQVKIATRNLKDTKLKAPFRGKLANNLIEEGAELIEGKIVGKFINTNKLNVEFFMGENIYTHFIKLLEKKIYVIWDKSNFKNNYLAEIFYVDSTINKERSGLNVRAELENISPNDPIKPGVFVKVMLYGDTITNSFLVNENFIYDDKFILILDKDKAVRKEVEVKGFAKNKVIVTGANLNGEQVILTRINNLSLLQEVISE